MKKPAEKTPPFREYFKVGQVVKTPDGERTVITYYGASLELDRGVIVPPNLLAYKWFSQDTVKGWQE